MKKIFVIPLFSLNALLGLVLLIIVGFDIHMPGKKPPVPIDTLGAMIKTLEIAYPKLSKYEAKYYAFVFKDFSDTLPINWQIYSAMIWIESQYNPTLTSKDKARGLTQMLDETVKRQTKKLGIKYHKGVTVWTEFLSLPLGMSYLTEGIYYPDSTDSTTMYINYEHGLRWYVSGSRTKSSRYIDWYYETVYGEYQKLLYIYQGVLKSDGKQLSGMK